MILHELLGRGNDRIICGYNISVKHYQQSSRLYSFIFYEILSIVNILHKLFGSTAFNTWCQWDRWVDILSIITILHSLFGSVWLDIVTTDIIIYLLCILYIYIGSQK